MTLASDRAINAKKKKKNIAQDLYNIFIDFKKAFNRVWHAALWAIIKKHYSAPTLFESLNTSMIRPPVQSSLTAA